MMRRFQALLLILATPLACAALNTMAVAGDVVRTFGERATSGLDPDASLAAMKETSRWLRSQRASVPRIPGILVELDLQERLDIGEETCSDCDGRLLLQPGKLRVGVVKSVSPALRFRGLSRASLTSGAFANGAIRETADGLVWTLAVEARESRALRLHLTGFSLPEGAELYLYNENESYGPYVESGPHGDGEFWSHSVNGPVAYLQLHYSGRTDTMVLERIRFQIAQLAYLGSRSLNASLTDVLTQTSGAGFCSFNETCVENASCATMPQTIQDARDGAAHIQWVSGPFIYICSGGLLTDTDPNGQVPLFLTANHCVSRGKDARNLETFFQFSVPCGDGCPQPFQDPPGVTKLLGATVLSSSASSDYTLMQLKEQPPAGSFFLGWTNEPVAFTESLQLYRISHPGGAPQAYSEHAVDTSAPTCLNTARGDWIYSRDIAGATEGGSSGSPVLNASGQVVGQLTGACGTNTGDSCDAVNNATIDGALAAYYSSVAEWLDPDNGGGDPDGACDNDGVCEPEEDCSTCVDCDGLQKGRPSSRYCCGNGVLEQPEGDGSICDGIP